MQENLQDLISLLDDVLSACPAGASDSTETARSAHSNPSILQQDDGLAGQQTPADSLTGQRSQSDTDGLQQQPEVLQIGPPLGSDSNMMACYHYEMSFDTKG